uniref:Basement membrane proteoglycan n=1 Tax=Anisakis simplex TaxID=6269 RepID=A0A0M3IZC9_ANISI
LASDGLLEWQEDQIKDAHPMVRPVGQEAHLTCPAEHAPGVSGTAEWEKVGGDLPYAYSIRNGELILKDLSRYDEGIYRCTIRAESGMATVTYINLQVSGQFTVWNGIHLNFVPSFNGSGFVKLKPMTINEWEDVNIKLSVKPKMRDGLIFYTSRGKEGQDHADNFISVGLRRGKVVYRYDVGDGLEEIASTYPVRANEWHRIELKNNKDKAVLYVDSHDIVEKKNEGFAISEAPPTNISIGGMENLQSKPQAGFARGFDGVISELLVSGRPIDIGEEALASFGIVEQSTICSINPCQHGGLCVPANVHRGFACNCERTDGFEGEFCERRSRKCNGEKCAVGSCVLDESNGSHSCLCPYGRIGRLCEHIDRGAHQKPLNAIRFNGESSFLSLPPPSTLRNYTLELLVSPRTTQDQLLAYVASDYDPKHSNFMGLVMENGKFVYVYNNGDGDFEIEDAEQVKEGNAYRVELKRIGPKGEFGINDRKVASRRQQPSFQVGTDLFVGGLPPGVAPHRRLEQYSSLNGCIYKWDISVFDVSENMYPCNSLEKKIHSECLA